MAWCLCLSVTVSHKSVFDISGRIELAFGMETSLSLSISLFLGNSGMYGWLGIRVVSVLDSGAEGLGSNRSRDAVG